MASIVVACSGNANNGTSDNVGTGTLRVTGAVAGLTNLDNSKAVAFASDGTAISSYLDEFGRFRLDLPVGHAYRVLIANSTHDDHLVTIGHLVNQTSQGSTDWIGARNP